MVTQLDTHVSLSRVSVAVAPKEIAHKQHVHFISIQGVRQRKRVSVVPYRRRHEDLGRVQKREQAIDLGPRLLSAPQNAQKHRFSLPLLGSQVRLRRSG